MNSADFARIRPLFAPDAVAEWNNRATVVGVAAMAAPYAALFKDAKFDTDFQYDAVDIYGDAAIVRTHHPVGQTELSLKDGARTLDLNREIFVLHQVGPDWKIILYTFTTQPRQESKKAALPRAEALRPPEIGFRSGASLVYPRARFRLAESPGIRGLRARPTAIAVHFLQQRATSAAQGRGFRVARMQASPIVDDGAHARTCAAFRSVSAACTR